MCLVKSCCFGFKPLYASIIFRSLGVHISFVRSIAMDSWSDKQLAIMKGGGNDKCNQYLKSKGIDPRAPIKQKYESDAAQLYKEVLKARVEGRPEPTSLPKPAVKSHSAPSSMNRPMNGISSGGGVGGGGSDPNGMERLAGESEQAYVARQTRLREEARQRMQAKFGNTSRMGGVGSNPGYNPNAGYGGSGLDDVMSGVSTVFSSGLSLVGGAATTVGSSIRSIATDSNPQSTLSTLGATAGSFWDSLSSAAGQVATAMTQPGEEDGLESLQRQFAQNKPMQSKYAGFGSAPAPPPPSGQSFFDGFGVGAPAPAAAPSSSFAVQEAPGLPGEDRNGVGRLSGESDQQYIARQTRLREEAKARMAAKFGGGGLSSASSSSSAAVHTAPTSMPPTTNSSSQPVHEAPGLPGEDRNGVGRLTGESDQQYVARQTRLREEAKARMAAKFGGGGLSSASSSSPSPSWLAPSSGNSNTMGGGRGMVLSQQAPPPTASSGGFGVPPSAQRSSSNSGMVGTAPAPARKLSKDNDDFGDDFFSSFGT